MKAKLGGLGGLKMLLLAHGEKLGIVIVGALVLLLVYKSFFGRERLPANLQAGDLQEQIQLARASVENSNWDQAPPDAIRKEEPLAQTGERMVDVEDYRGDSRRFGWNAPLVPPTVLRTDPVLLEAQDVEAYGSSGLLAFTNEAIRDARLLEERAREARREQEREQQQEQLQREQERGRRGRRGAEQDRFGLGAVDPEHPNRRQVMGPVGSTGVPLQGDEQVVTAYWAMVVAKIPIKDQIRTFKDVFENARGYSEGADFPNYLGYFVERAEVRPGQELEWKPVRVENGKGEPIGPAVSHRFLYGEQETDGRVKKKGVVSDWAASYPEVVDQRYLDPSGVLAFPLPPLVGRDFGFDLAASHSEIPLAADAVELEEEEQPVAEAAQPAEGEDEGNMFRSATADVPQRFGAGMRSPYGPGGGYPGRGGYDAEMRSMGGYPRGGGRGEYGYPAEGGYEGYSRSARGGMGADMTPRVDNWLLRFFDFSVEPGKKYKYRIRLVVQDPNRNAAKSTLDSSVSDRLKADKSGYRITEPSKPSRTVSIPLAGTVRVASADAANERSYTSEPDVTLLVESFDADDKGKSIQGAIEADFRRGGVANLTEDAEILVEQGRAIDKEKDFRFRTGITVVDIRGGERLSRNMETEARVLLMDPAGQLFVQQESDDLDAVERHRAIFAESDEADRYGVPGGRGGYPGARGMDMMEYRGR